MDAPVWVLAEQQDGALLDSSIEILGEARRLADVIGCNVCAFSFGDGAADVEDALGEYGADEVRIYTGEMFASMDTERYVQAFSEAYGLGSPRLLVVAQTSDGSAFAPRFAARIGCAYAANTVDIAVDERGCLSVRRALCGGQVHELCSYPPRPMLIATFEPGLLDAPVPCDGRRAVRLGSPYSGTPYPHIDVLEVEPADTRSISLDEASRVLALGMAYRDADQIRVASECADGIGAALGGSKPVADAGLIAHDRMIGQSSGRRIAPELFIAAGISGSTHFLEGMKGSQTIVALNTDKAAPMMKLADLACACDAHEVLGILCDRIRAAKAGE